MIVQSLLTPFDLHLFNEGSHSHLYEKLGATNRATALMAAVRLGLVQGPQPVLS